VADYLPVEINVGLAYNTHVVELLRLPWHNSPHTQSVKSELIPVIAIPYSMEPASMSSGLFAGA
jgi:hypothetical protein